MIICRILEGVRAKNLEAIILFVDFSKAFDSIHRGKIEQILLAYGLPKETVAAIMMLYKNAKVKVRSPNGDTDYFNIVADLLQGDTLALYLFIICLDYVLRTSIDIMKDNGFKLAKERSGRYPAQTTTDADFVDDIVLLANTPAQAESLLHSLERAAAGHCWRSKGELISYIRSWTPLHGRAKVGRPARTYIQQLSADTEYSLEDLPEAMDDRDGWRGGWGQGDPCWQRDMMIMIYIYIYIYIYM